LSLPERVSYRVCHDESLDRTLWAHHEIDGLKLGGSGGDQDFRVGGNPKFFALIQQCGQRGSYTRIEQYATFEEILGSIFTNYIAPPDDPGTNLYLARGHLAPAADFREPAYRAATYFYINASPMWQVINQGNWLVSY